jgi:hypothetical protein
MQNKTLANIASNATHALLINENNSNLSGVPSVTIIQKPDSYYLQEINKITCPDSDILVQDNTYNTYEQDNYFCYNNGNKGDSKKLVQWKKVDGLWLNRHLTNSSEYKEMNNNVCKIVTPGCDSYNPSQGCVVKCYLDDKSTSVFTANYLNLPN